MVVFGLRADHYFNNMMEINDQHRKMLQSLMVQPQWAGFEAFFEAFMRQEFVQQSVKRDTEFQTIWYAAEQEGAKRKLLEFKQLMEDEARLV